MKLRSTILDKGQGYNRVALQFVWGIVGCIALVGLTGCSDDRPTVQDIQSEFESLGFHFEVWDDRDVFSDFPGIGGVSLIGVNRVLASRLDIELDVKGDSPIEGADWNIVSLSFYGPRVPRRLLSDHTKIHVEYEIALISLLIPDMKNEIRQWIANSNTDIGTYTRRFGKMTVENKVQAHDEWEITFRPDKD